MGFLSHNGGETYTTCHCKSYSIPHSYMLIRQMRVHCAVWSNFEIADMDFWRGPAYTAFFDYLDSTGGFYYEVRVSPFFFLSRTSFSLLYLKRWGDAPVHSIAAGLFARKDQIHFFEEIGYQHDDWSHCPLNNEMWEEGRCACSPRNSFGNISFFQMGFLEH
jgi:alpha 1,2-mannosyltransferase